MSMQSLDIARALMEKVNSLKNRVQHVTVVPPPVAIRAR